MAEKKEKEFSYGSSFLPEGEKKYSVIRWGWNGLNKEDQIDTGQLTDMNGMICDPPYMYPNKKPKVWLDFQNGIPVNSNKVSTAGRVEGKIISIAGFDNQLCLVWEFKDTSANPNVYTPFISRFLQSGDDILINQSYLEDHNLTTANKPRSIVQFNVVDTSSDNIVTYSYDRKLLIYPDCYSVPYTFDKRSDHWPVTASDFNTAGNPIPVSDKSAVYQSRVFGTNNNATFASDYNSYAAYNLDTADDVSSAHAWWSMTNSNTEADGAVTAMCTYDNHVVIFKKDFMQLVYNNKNPFRIVDVGAFGCVSNKAWTIMNGVLYFASQEKIYAFTGGTPKEISKNLDIDDFSFCALGSYKNKLYVSTIDAVYTFSDGVWSELLRPTNETASYVIRQFATLDFGIVALAEYLTSSAETNYYKLLLLDWDTDFLETKPTTSANWEPDYSGSWWFQTDLMALGKLDVRRVKKLSALCEGQPGSEMNVYLLKPNETFGRTSSALIGTVKFKAATAEPFYEGESGFKMLRVLTRQFSSTMHRLYFTGKGYMKIHAAELKISWGGDLYAEQK